MIHEVAEVMGINEHNIELTEGQIQLVNTKTGYAPTLIVRIRSPMPILASEDTTE